MKRRYSYKKICMGAGLLLSFIILMMLFTACDKPPITLGFIATLSGRKANLGVHARNGVQLAVDQINEGGGIRGRRIKLLVYDDGDSVSSAREAFRNLEAEAPDVIIGPVTSVMADAVYDLIIESRIPVVSPSVTSSKYQNRKDNFYLLMTPNTEQGRMISGYLVSRNLNKSFGVFDISNRSYAEGVIDDTAAFLAMQKNKDSFNITKVEYDSREEPSLRDISRKMAADDTDAVVLACNGLDAAYFVQSLDLEGYKGSVIGAAWSMSIDAIPLFGDLSERIRFIGLTNPSDQSERYKRFNGRYIELFQMNPLHVAVFSYDSVQLVKTAIESGRDLRVDSSEVFTGMEVTSGCQVDFFIDGFGDSTRQLYLLKIQGQTFTVDE